MKEMSVCPGCMRSYRGDRCPRCGEVPEGLYVPFALEVGTALGNEVILGRALDAGESLIRYIGYDQRKKRRVLVRELFVPALMMRGEDGSVHPRSDAAAKEATRLVLSWGQRRGPLISCNNTVYEVVPYPLLPWSGPARTVSAFQNAWSAAQGARAEQQDACQCCQGTDWTYAVLCDGMGGLPHGARASRWCAAQMAGYLPGLLAAAEGDIPALLRQQARETDMGMACLQDEAGRPLGCGTTLVCAYVRGSRLYYATVGDSHLYLIRGDSILQLNEEHNLISRMRRQGIEESSPQAEALTSYIGMGGGLEIDCGDKPFCLEPGDALLLCSDGVYRALTDRELIELCSGLTAREAAVGIIGRVEERRLPGQDNATCAVLRLLPDRRRRNRAKP